MLATTLVHWRLLFKLVDIAGLMSSSLAASIATAKYLADKGQQLANTDCYCLIIKTETASYPAPDDITAGSGERSSRKCMHRTDGSSVVICWVLDGSPVMTIPPLNRWMPRKIKTAVARHASTTFFRAGRQQTASVGRRN